MLVSHIVSSGAGLQGGVGVKYYSLSNPPTVAPPVENIGTFKIAPGRGA